jgi:hypothetical protein
MLWAELELDPAGTSMELAACLKLRFVTAPGALRELTLARTHPHPRQLFCDAGASTELVRTFRRS